MEFVPVCFNRRATLPKIIANTTMPITFVSAAAWIGLLGIKEYNDLGITVRYLAFPRAGMNETARQMEAIWTSKDPVFALNEAEKGNLAKELKTPNIVKRHYDLGVQLGVQGTPSIVTSTGEVLGGYLKPHDLLAVLQESAQ